MALPANALTTVATLCGELGVDVPASGSATEASLERLIGVASDAIEALCDRRFAKATRTEKVPGYGTDTLRLREYPTLSVSAVSYDGTAVDADEYATTPEVDDAKAGLLRNLLGTWSWTADYRESAAPEQQAGTERRLYSITYVAGYVLPKDATEGNPRTLPYQLEEACLLTCVASYRARGRDQSIVSESLLSASVSYAGSQVNTANGRGAGGIIPDNAVALLAPFVRWS